MAIELSKIYLTPGRLLVEPIEKSRQDIFEVSESGREISAANVVKVGRLDVEFEGLVPGAAIIYERLNSEALTLQDEEGKDKVYRFVLVRDVAGWVPPVGWEDQKKAFDEMRRLAEMEHEMTQLDWNIRTMPKEISDVYAKIKENMLSDLEAAKDPKYDRLGLIGGANLYSIDPDNYSNRFSVSDKPILPDNIVLSHQPEIKQRIVEILSKYLGSKVDVIESGNDKVIVAVDITGIKGERADYIVGGMGYIGGVDPIDPVFSMKVFEDDAKKMAAPRKSILETSNEMEREQKGAQAFRAHIESDGFYGYLRSICQDGKVDIETIDPQVFFRFVAPEWKWVAFQKNGDATFFHRMPVFHTKGYWVQTGQSFMNVAANFQEMEGMYFVSQKTSEALIKRP